MSWDRTEKWFGVGLFAAVLVVLSLLGFAFIHKADRHDSCAAAGGVVVDSHPGPMVCIRDDAVIPEEEWR